MVSRSFTRSKSHAYACYQDLRTVRVQPCNHTLGMVSETGSISFDTNDHGYQKRCPESNSSFVVTETGSISFDTNDHGYHERRIAFGAAFLAFGTRGETSAKATLSRIWVEAGEFVRHTTAR